MDYLKEHLISIPRDDSLPPVIRIRESTLSDITTTDESVDHDVRTVRKIQIEGRWYYKKILREGTQPQLLELEAFCNDIYSLLLGDCSPQSIVVVDDNNIPTALLVQSIDDYSPVTCSTELTIDECIKGSLIDVLIALYFLEEDDAHDKGNLGRNAKGQFVTIDHDMSWWSVAILWKGSRLKQVASGDSTVDAIFSSEPIRTIASFFSGTAAITVQEANPAASPAGRSNIKFPITETDLFFFPFLSHAKPFHWPGNWLGIFQNQSIRDRFFQDTIVNSQKLFMFSMICLIPKDFFKKAAFRHFENKGHRVQAFMSLNTRKLNLFKTLCKLESFRSYFRTLALKEGKPIRRVMIQKFIDFSERNSDHYQFSDSELRGYLKSHIIEINGEYPDEDVCEPGSGAAAAAAGRP